MSEKDFRSMRLNCVLMMWQLWLSFCRTRNNRAPERGLGLISERLQTPAEICISLPVHFVPSTLNDSPRRRYRQHSFELSCNISIEPKPFAHTNVP